MPAAITFDQVERRADQTLGVVYLVRHLRMWLYVLLA